MQVGRTPLSPEKRERRIREHLCLYCGQMEHLRASCQTWPPQQSTPRVSTSILPNYSASCIEVPVEIVFSTSTIVTKALLDSGAAGNFIDEDLAQQFNIPLIHCKSPLAVPALDRHPLGTGHILSSTTDITLQVGILHIIQLSLVYPGFKKISSDILAGETNYSLRHPLSKTSASHACRNCHHHSRVKLGP